MKTNRRSSASAPRVILYYRNSHEQQEASIERQESVLEPYAQKQSWNVVERIYDEDISGGEVIKRAGLQRMLGMIRRGEADGIGIDSFARLLRLDLIKMGALLDPIRDAGVWIEGAKEGRFDYDSMTGRVMMGLTSEVDHGKLLSTARDALTQHLRMARDLGAPPLPKTPMGYIRVDDMQAPLNKRGARPGKWVIDDQAAAIVRQMFQWFVKGHSTYWIACELQQRGIPAPGGRGQWRKNTIRRMLRNVAYVGDRAFGKTSQGKYYRLRHGEIVAAGWGERAEVKPREEWMISTGTHPAIIDRPLFAEVQARLDRASKGEVLNEYGEVIRRTGTGSGPTGNPTAFILSKLLVCDVCKGFLTGTHNKRNKTVKEYQCCLYVARGPQGCVRCMVEEEPMIKRLLAEVKAIASPERREAIKELLATRLREDRQAEELADLRKQSRSLEADMTKWRTRLRDVSPDMLGEVEDAIRDCRQRQAELAEAIAAKESSDPGRDLDTALKEAVKELWIIDQACEEGDRLKLMEALHGIIDHVVITPKPVQIGPSRIIHEPGAFHIVLRKGSGLAFVSNLDTSHRETFQVRNVTVSVSA